MAEERRVVELPDGRVFYLRKPGMQEHEEAEWEYSRVFNKAIKNGIVPREVMKNQLRDQEIWTEEDDAKLEAIEEEMVVAMTELKEAADEDDEPTFNRARNRIVEIRNEQISLNSSLNAFLNNCAEEKANEARIYYLSCVCAETEDGKPFWKDYKTFKSKETTEVANITFLNFMLFLNNMSSDLSEVLVENKVKLKSDRPEEQEKKNQPAEAVEVSANAVDRSRGKA